MFGLGLPSASAQESKVPTGTQSSHDMEEAPVLKVFSAENGGHRFVAYMVKWKGNNVIVSDPLARSNYHEGDKISFMAHKLKLPGSRMAVSSLSFTLMDTPPGTSRMLVPPEERNRLMRITEGNLDAASNENERFYALNRAAKKALKEGKTEEARKLATELERLAPNYRNDWNYGNAVQDANQVLGRIALAKGDIAEAKKRLLASADSNGSPQMNSFGPNMQLAKDLLTKGEREVVIEYFNRCGKFWEMGKDRLSAWTDTVRKDGTPAFGSNLEY
jgi:hypothetical protein